MKKTLHSIHHSTVLPRLGASKKESLQNLHTHAIDWEIQLQENNKVLKYRLPPIANREQKLNRKQRCTLSELRLGHYHLLQDYKHRVFSNPSDICTDGRASPKDVRHLSACNAHPTALTPEDLWQNRFVSSATSTTGTLNDLTTNQILANNNMVERILLLQVEAEMDL